MSAGERNRGYGVSSGTRPPLQSTPGRLLLTGFVNVHRFPGLADPLNSIHKHPTPCRGLHRRGTARDRRLRIVSTLLRFLVVLKGLGSDPYLIVFDRPVSQLLVQGTAHRTRL